MQHGSTSRTFCRWLAAALCLAPLLVASPAHALSTVVPNAAATVKGSGLLSNPFNTSPSQRYQQAYAASQFSGAQIITEIRFRQFTHPSAGAFSATVQNVRVDLSTTSRAVTGLSNTFAQNVGADNTTVYGDADGEPLTLSSSATGPVNGPRDFDVVIPLSQPFRYDPARGNLLLDVYVFNNNGYSGAFLDAGGPGSVVSLVTSYSSGVNAAIGDRYSVGLITRFEAIPLTGDFTSETQVQVLQQQANPATRSYLYYVQVKNTRSYPLYGKLELVLEDLPAGIVVQNRAGYAPAGWGYQPNSPYLLLNLPGDLLPGQSAVFVIRFTSPLEPPADLFTHARVHAGA